MALELDHLFVWTSPGAPEIDRLLQHGFAEGRPNTHSGQGTACRCIFFQNAYLEFLWIDDPAAAQSELIRPLQLWERSNWRENGSSPFGIGLRSSNASSTDIGELPFPTWKYRPAYHPPNSHLDIAASSDSLTEPLIFHSPSALRPGAWPTDRQQPMMQPAASSMITRLVISSPMNRQLGLASEKLAADGLVEFRLAPASVAEVNFDRSDGNKQLNLQPELPMVFRW